MSLFSTYAKAHNELLRRLFQKTVLKNYRRYCRQKKGHALLYYKTDSLVPGYLHTYQHTNHWEITEIGRLLNQLGYWVDIIDRRAPASLQLQDKYDIFIANALSDSTQNYPIFANQLPSAKKVLYATCSYPEIHNQRLLARHHYFTARNNYHLPLRRLITNVDMLKLSPHIDAIFSVANDYNNQTFNSLGKPLYRIYTSTTPHLSIAPSEISQKNPHHFLFFGGSGNLLKGLDLALETFSKLPHLNLFVAGPLEKDFINFYQPLLNRSPNIHIKNFVPVNSSKFINLTRHCAFIFLPSATEGTATSVTTCLRRGLIPLVTPETGIDTEDFGFLLENIQISTLTKTLNHCSTLTTHELHQRIERTIEASKLYTQSSFTQSFQQALQDTLAQNHA
jgi:hypothetical protein